MIDDFIEWAVDQFLPSFKGQTESLRVLRFHPEAVVFGVMNKLADLAGVYQVTKETDNFFFQPHETAERITEILKQRLTKELAAITE